jgi:transposase
MLLYNSEASSHFFLRNNPLCRLSAKHTIKNNKIIFLSGEGATQAWILFEFIEFIYFNHHNAN